MPYSLSYIFFGLGFLDAVFLLLDLCGFYSGVMASRDFFDTISSKLTVLIVVVFRNISDMDFFLKEDSI